MDPYTILGVPPSASDDEIRCAYRRITLQTHPDKIGNDSRVKEFYEAQAAFQLLRDPEQRKRYDALNQGKRSSLLHDIVDLLSKAYANRRRMEDIIVPDVRSQSHAPLPGTYTPSPAPTESEGDLGAPLPTASGDKLLTHDPQLDTYHSITVPLVDVYNNMAKEVFIVRTMPDGTEETKAYTVPLCNRCVTIRGGGNRTESSYGHGHITIKVQKTNNVEKRGADLVVRDTVKLKELFAGVRRDYGFIVIDEPAPLKAHRFDGDELTITLLGKGLPLSFQSHERGDLTVTLKLEKPDDFYTKLGRV